MNSLIWKRRIARFCPVVNKRGRKVILIFHAVGNGPWAIPADHFKEQIQWLKTHCEIVPLTKLLASQLKKDTVQVALTFDDGYACLHDIVLPILQAESAVATVYVNTGWMGEMTRKVSNPNLGHYPGELFLTWDEVKKLDRCGWEIGSHGVEHIDLTMQSEKIIFQELKNSKLNIENILEKPCVHFAYTFGKHSKIVRKAVSDAGYQYAVAAHHTALKNNDSIALPRLNIEVGYSIEDFKNIIYGRWDFLGTIHRIKRIGY